MDQTAPAVTVDDPGGEESRRYRRRTVTVARVQDMGLPGLALWLISTMVFFYVLYFVVRAAVRDGIRQALPHATIDARAVGQSDA